MLAMAIYDILAAALNFGTIMHSSVTLCGSLFSTWKERTKSAFAVTTRKLSVCKFQNISWRDCSKKHKTIKTLCLLNWFPTKINCPVANGNGDQCAIQHCKEYIKGCTRGVKTRFSNKRRSMKLY